MKNISPLQKKRLSFKPALPDLLKNISKLTVKKKEKTSAFADVEDLKIIFKNSFGQEIVEIVEGKTKENNPLKIGVVFSGGQASGGHNVITGLFDALKSLNSKSQLFGFLGGPSGIVDCNFKELKKEELENFRNQGGFDLIGSGRTKIETEEQLQKSLECSKANNFDGIVVIGGDDSNTNAAILAEYFMKNNCSTKVVGVPKTIDGDLKNENIEMSFGFDTACKVYSELIGNIARDALSAKKYYHFIKLMGRSASHIALECALKTHPNFVLISEEVLHYKKTLNQIVKEIADVIVKRSDNKKNYGIILIPEGLIEFIPEMKVLIQELNKLLAENKEGTDITKLLSKESLNCFNFLPKEIQNQLLLDRDPHGNVKVSQIETEKLLIELVKKELKKRDFKGKFSALNHFLGYEGRAGMPSNFDAQYCYSLGYVAALLINEGLSGYMSALANLKSPIEKWIPKGIPLTSMMNIEERDGKKKPVIKKALVELNGNSYKLLKENNLSWQFEDSYIYPGPIQYFGEKELTDEIPMLLRI